ncbi:MAG: tRNA (N(6)-L-threonylcarbamoyladenosine(37)-C(2))-methylthiotransferase MtaB [Candidatus Desulforudis sp.]|nr:tRNA (N(6)-L-threonylcarbamoyladenosine(37)-C(2))-methylthiotransferase MtaB [Desulforudis sp.]
MKTVAFHTLGCKVNQYETQGLAALFRERGYQVVPFEERADVYVVNTCTVTHIGDRKSRQVVRRAVRNNPDALVLVTGCYAQVSPAEVSGIPGVDLVIGTTGRERIVDLVEEASRGRRPVLAVEDVEKAPGFEELPGVDDQGGRTRAFIKVQEGCRDFCTYCIVPYARGPLRSRPSETVLALAARLVDEGHRELVLTGINLGAYGCDLGDQNLAGLVRRLARIRGLLRLRLSSVEPHEITPELVEAVAENPVCCPHFHIPLQSGSDTVLDRMGRRYSTADYASLLELIRARVPEVAVTTDVMVGFPGETDAEHRDSLACVRRLEFTGLHVFVFSPRRGTPAASSPGQIPYRAKQERSREMLALDRELRHRFYSRYRGRKVEVLVETVADGVASGYTRNYLRTFFKTDSELVGQVVELYVEGAERGNLRGIILDKAGFLIGMSNKI